MRLTPKAHAVLAGLLLHSASVAMASTEIKQTVLTSFHGQNYQAKHIWSLDQNKFRLDVDNGKSQTHYIFNGRVFYICSSLDENQIAFLAKNQINKPAVLNKFKKGACQIVPSNFMARFFLSPTDAVESIDRTDGMLLTLDLSQYKVDAAKQASNSPYKCDGLKRSYKITKSDKASGTTYASQTDETLCMAKNLDWRKGLWREVSKTVMRQPGGAKFMGDLRKDYSKIKGLALTSEISVTHSGPKSSAQKGTRRLVTDTVKEVKLDKNHFSIPRGFEIFSPEAVARELAETSTQSKGKGKADKGADGSALPSIFLCALSGSFVCLQ